MLKCENFFACIKNCCIFAANKNEIKMTHTTHNDIKTLAKNVLDMYMYQHISIGMAIALVTTDIHIAVQIKEYIEKNF